MLTMGRTGAIANDAGPDELSCLRSSAPRMAPARTTGRRRAASRRGAGGARGLGSGARLRGPLAYEPPLCVGAITGDAERTGDDLSSLSQ